MQGSNIEDNTNKQDICDIGIPEIELHVLSDYMKAVINIKLTNKDQKVTYEMIIEALEKEKITYGICHDNIRQFCLEGKFIYELTVSRGLHPIDGIDGSIKYLFETSTSSKPVEKDDGTVDFRNLGLVHNVLKGTVLCEITPPTSGSDGVNIYGKKVEHRKGITPSFPMGENTVESEDKTKLLAAVDGCVSIKSSYVCVSSVYIIKGNVDNNIGNIDFVGSVVINGDVREGFRIISGESVTVKGLVENATIEAKGNIVVSNGMAGMGKGKLTAGGSVTCKFIENAIVECNGNVYADIILNCNINTKSSIILKGKKAALIGGNYFVGESVSAKNIGAYTYVNTNITVLSQDLENLLTESQSGTEEAKRDLRTSINSYKSELNELELTAKDMATDISARLKATALKLYIVKKNELKTKISKAENKLERLMSVNNNIGAYKIVCTNTVYPGTRINIGNFSLSLKQEYKFTKFFILDNSITFAPLNPADIDK